jgi:CxxC-x17-CxxC domain-containing protein
MASRKKPSAAAPARAPKRDGKKPRTERGKKPAAAEARRVGGARNEFGTRIARRIECTRCGKEDHVPFVPKDATKALCRACAAEVIKTYEEGVRVRMPTKPAVCNLCGVPFELPVAAEDDGDPLCKNCLLGFTTWRGSVDVPFAERAKQVLEPRRAGTVLRKRGPAV